VADERRVASDPSRTAETTATQRAAEQHMPAARRLLHDPYARHFVRRPPFRLMANIAPLARVTLRLLDRRFPGLHAIILLRAAYADRVIEDHPDVGQVVLMGAGFDSSAWRFARERLRFFEVDAPTTQNAKRELMARAGLESPAVLVPCDFEVSQPAQLLLDAGLDPAKPTLTIWLGVTYYLTEEAFRGALADIAGYTREGGLLVLDYGDPTMIDEDSPYVGARRAAAWVEKRGEPYLTGFTRDELAGELASAGFELTESLHIPELAERVGPPGGAWCSLDDWARVALAQRSALNSS
jgi:methyltransferase (TIGR00027 family)